MTKHWKATEGGEGDFLPGQDFPPGPVPEEPPGVFTPAMHTNTKTCWKCHLTKTASEQEFFRDDRTRDGLAGRCKACAVAALSPADAIATLPAETSPDPTPGFCLSTDSAARKEVPMATGLLDYFPLALADVARLSKLGNDKHNPGEAMHWSRHKSSDHADCIVRHLVDRGTFDTDGLLHDTKVAWRALAQLQVAIERLRAAGKDY